MGTKLKNKALDTYSYFQLLIKEYISIFSKEYGSIFYIFYHFCTFQTKVAMKAYRKNCEVRQSLAKTAEIVIGNKAHILALFWGSDIPKVSFSKSNVGY